MGWNRRPVRRVLGVASVLTGVLLLGLPGVVFASGGYGGGGGGRYSGYDRPKSDPTYDLGKSVYSGRSKSQRGLRICLAPEEGVDDTDRSAKTRPLSRRNLRAFRKAPLTRLTTRLVNCDVETEYVAETLERREFAALVYYLDERFDLKLAR